MPKQRRNSSKLQPVTVFAVCLSELTVIGPLIKHDVFEVECLGSLYCELSMRMCWAVDCHKKSLNFPKGGFFSF